MLTFMSIDWTKRPEKRFGLALFFILLGGVFAASMGAIAKFLAPIQTAEALIFWRNFVGLLLFTPWILFAPPHVPIREKLRVNHWKLPLIRGVSSFFSVLLYYYSLKSLSLTTATLMFNTMPIFVPLVAFVWQRVVIIKNLWWGLGVAFLGIILALNPEGQVFHPVSFLALLSGLLGAINFVSLRLSHFTESFERNIFYLFIIGLTLSTFFTLFSFQESWASLTPSDLKWLIAIGIAGLLYQIFITLSSKFAPARFISIFLYSSVIYAILLDRWIWHTQITLWTYLGFFLIVLGALLLLLLYPKEDLQIKS